MNSFHSNKINKIKPSLYIYIIRLLNYVKLKKIKTFVLLHMKSSNYNKKKLKKKKRRRKRETREKKNQAWFVYIPKVLEKV